MENEETRQTQLEEEREEETVYGEAA